MYQPHHYKCGGMTDKFGRHSLSCHHHPGRVPRHAALMMWCTEDWQQLGSQQSSSPEVTLRLGAPGDGNHGCPGPRLDPPHPTPGYTEHRKHW
ncbi:hypothetical protein Pcinc_039761 [Petrolisthes cinctipes]|uniref:Uncharacterized protein n=1 Tax=Petrolisthes cinctipes TaxID=88211 RepID=A0AAE1EIT3_PETCI|nr:hypothetical protein Pcinc_039761 [Petrolisthes cinctipes]